MVAHHESQVIRPDHTLQEHGGGVGFFVQHPGHVGSGIEQHADVENDVAVVGKELDGLLPAVFKDAEVILPKLAGQMLLLIANREVNGNQVNLAVKSSVLGAIALWRSCARQAGVG